MTLPPSLSSHQQPVTPPLTHPGQNFDWLDPVKVCVGIIAAESMCATTESCSEAGISRLSSPSNGSDALPVPSSRMFLVPWIEENLP